MTSVFGIGTDIAQISRIAAVFERYGEHFALRMLTPAELEVFHHRKDPARFLARRFAAKEAFSKALGTGLRMPVSLHTVGVSNNAGRRPVLHFLPPLAAYMRAKRLTAHISISDEVDYAVAFALVEQHPNPL